LYGGDASHLPLKVNTAGVVDNVITWLVVKLLQDKNV
jgi:preprotein translocase subunit SecY